MIKLEDISGMMHANGYISDPQVAMSVFLSLQLEKPLLVEGPAGVGKTEIAKVMANVLQTDLIRLQCYEGLDATHALYEWNYQRQLLHLKITEHDTGTIEEKEKTIFGESFLLKRPLLEAITHTRKPVLLIDEIDRSDEEFESFLLEVLSDWQITIPETGTITATYIPQVILTGNRTRDLSDALRRRCLYLYIDYPDFEKELTIVKKKVPGINEKLALSITSFMQEVRRLKLEKIPGISETLDWAFALAALHLDHLDKTVIEQTLGVIIKDWKDTRQVQMSLSELMEKTGVHPRVQPT
ncbi:AAA family ATPase [Flavihumibacter solisilvae]|uniref:ATPase n=1 Tax=Flavihumibacter solisilvae TaxID=1349421 RepID=A0A0C1LHZ1_9BACT|nr:MoxR family ATPase [Flavihumibacter solisilvae]KIC94993.1 ATPase [Flavihumibacter solisilvae]